jgi:DNA adenine methylase
MKIEDLYRSPLRWAGSKKKLLPALNSIAPKSFRRYVEPFCGSLCFLVALKPEQALVGDINEELIHFYKMIRWRPKKVATLTHSLPRDADTYYSLRSLAPNSLSPEQRAARFLYLNRFCFNGVYRTNRNGQFNVARGQHMGEIPPVDELIAFGRLMRHVNFELSDFSTLLENAGRGDFVYLDPPYAGRNVRDRGEYGVGAFKEHDIERLATQVDAASQRGAKILISYADLPQFRALFPLWNTTSIEVGRNVSGFSRGRTKVSELLICNYS